MCDLEGPPDCAHTNFSAQKKTTHARHPEVEQNAKGIATLCNLDASSRHVCQLRSPRATSCTSFHRPLHQRMIPAQAFSARRWLHGVKLPCGPLRPSAKGGRKGDAREQGKHAEEWHHPIGRRAGGFCPS